MNQYLPLSEFCTINMGQSPDSASYNTEKRGLPFFQGNADFGKLSPHVRIWCDTPTKIAHSGDLLISVRAPIGAINIADTDCCIGRGLAAMTCIEHKCDQRWLYFALQSKVAELQSKGTGSTFKAISKKTLFDTLLPDYTISEQQKIAEHLSSLSYLIAMREEQMKKLTLLASSRFVEMFGKLKEYAPLSSFGKISTGSTPTMRNKEYYENKDIPFLKPSDMSDTVSNLYHSEFFVDRRAESVCRMFDSGTILVSCIGSIGKIGIASIRGTCNQQINFIESDSDTNPIYIAYAISTKKQQLLDMAHAPVVPIINKTEFSKFSIPCAPLALQNEFAAFIEQLDKSKFTIRQSLEKLNLAYKAQLQEYFG